MKSSWDVLRCEERSPGTGATLGLQAEDHELPQEPGECGEQEGSQVSHDRNKGRFW